MRRDLDIGTCCMAILILLPFYWIQSGLNPPSERFAMLVLLVVSLAFVFDHRYTRHAWPIADSINWRNSMLEGPFEELFQEPTSSFEQARSLAMHHNLKRNERYIPIEWIWRAAEQSIEAFVWEMNLKMHCIKNEEETPVVYNRRDRCDVGAFWRGKTAFCEKSVL